VQCKTHTQLHNNVSLLGNLPDLFLSKEQMKPLHDVVLIKPQWLADVMKELIEVITNLNLKGMI